MKLLNFSMEELKKEDKSCFEKVKNLSSRDIAVIGVSGRLPMADSIEEFWSNLKNGVNCIRDIPYGRMRDIDDYLEFTDLKKQGMKFAKCAYINEIDKFDNSFFKISPKEAGLIDPNQRLFLETAYEAIDNAGYGGRKIIGSRTGVYVGFSNGLGNQYYNIVSQLDPSSFAMSMAGNLAPMISSRVSFHLDLKGPSITVDTTCSSSLVAVHLACQAIRNGECDMALSGSVKTILTPFQSNEKIGIESSDGITRSFDNSSDGTGFGEGVVAVLLKPLNKAVEDCDNIYAVIKGSAVNQDGLSVNITTPSPEAQSEVIIKAWRDAGVQPETISYIEAQGIGTKLGDPIEIEGIQRAFERYTSKRQFCAIGTIKPNIGHLDNASGITGFAKAVLALKHKEVPPSLYFEQPNRKINFEKSPVYICDRLTRWETAEAPRRCGVSSFGISGTNCHVVLEEAPGNTRPVGEKECRFKVLTLSAKSKQSLARLVEQYKKFIRTTDDSLIDICFTANTGREHHNIRIALLIENKEDLIEKLEHINFEDASESGVRNLFYSNTLIKEGTMGCKQEDALRGTEEKQREAHNKVKAFVASGSHSEEILKDICSLYVNGIDIDWDVLYQNIYKRRTVVPAYSFDKKRCWFEIPNRTRNSEVAGSDHVPVKLTGREGEDNYSGLEKQIGEVWGELLGLNEICIDDSFFELGGNSLTAVKFELEMEKRNSNIRYSDIEEHSTIRELARISESGTDDGGTGGDGAWNSIEAAEICPLPDDSMETEGKTDKDMGYKIALDNVEPFDRIFYRNCFYQSLLPVITHFKISTLTLLTNDIIAYNYKDSGEDGRFDFGVEYMSCKPIEDIFKDVGLLCEARSESINIVNDIELSISRGRPVVIWVDCFYETIRPDMYNKTHWPHTWMVYGFDKASRTFGIIEHINRDSKYYTKQTISYKDVENSYKGYQQNFKESSGMHDFYSFYKVDSEFSIEKGQIDYKAVLSGNMNQQKSRLYMGLNGLKMFANKMEGVIADKNFINSHLETVLNGVNDIINAKKAEKYRNSEIFGENHEAASRAEQIIKEWTLIRTALARFLYTSDYKQLFDGNTIYRLKEICRLEEEYLQIF